MRATLRLALAAALTAATASTAQAQFIGSGISITAHSGFGSGATICKAASVSRTVLGGGELLGTDWTGGCVGDYAADITDDLITLTVTEGGNYSFADFTLDVLSGPTITGFSFVGYNGSFFDPSYGFNESNFSPALSFTASSLGIVWNTFSDDFTGGQFRFADAGVGVGTATFRFTTTSVVPEPGSMLLLATGLLGLGFVARRRRVA